MKLSISVASNRPSYWERFCTHISQNSIETEVIIVGPCDDRPNLPISVKYVKSQANTVLAWAIGAKIATGDLLAFAPDDLLYQPGFLDAVAITATTNNFDMISANYFRNGINQLHDQRMLGIPSMPLLPIGGFIKINSYRQLGGLDKRFHSVLFDIDLYMRCYEVGGRTILLDGYTCHESNPDNQNLLFARYNERDRAVLKSLWFRDNKPNLQRTSSVQQFTDEEIRLACQS